MTSAGSAGTADRPTGFGQSAAHRAAGLALPVGLAAAVIGMAMVAAGVVVRGVFLPGVIVLTGGLLLVAAGAALRAAAPGA